MKFALLILAVALAGCAHRQPAADTRPVAVALERSAAQQASALASARQAQESTGKISRHVHEANMDVSRIDGKATVILRWLDARQKARHAP